MGTSSNGLKAKKASLENAVKFFNTIQETKLRQNAIIKLNGYQIFRVGLRGGCLNAVKHELIYQCEEESEIKVVLVKIDSKP